MANKRKNDPEFYSKQKAYNAQRKKERYANDEEYKKKELEYNKKYMAEKNKYKEMYEQKLKEDKEKVIEVVWKDGIILYM